MPEQDKKRWRMLKKVVLVEEFSLGTENSIIPKFASGSYQATDKYGVWKLSGTSGCNPWNAVDGTISTKASKLSVSSFDIYIDVPEGCSISPSQAYVRVNSSYFPTTVSGYNPLTGEWEKLCKSNSNINDMKITTENYYTRFKLLVASTSTYDAPRIHEFRLCAGKIKINK